MIRSGSVQIGLIPDRRTVVGGDFNSSVSSFPGTRGVLSVIQLSETFYCLQLTFIVQNTLVPTQL